MADTDKLNIDSIIARLLEGKYLLLDICQIISSSFFRNKTNAKFRAVQNILVK